MPSVDVSKEAWASLDNEPLVPAPPDIDPNFENPVWHGQSVVIAASICTPLMLLVASTRIYTKRYITRKWTRDDNIFSVSLAAAIMFITLVLAMTCGGAFGYHAWDLKLGQMTKAVLVRSFLLTILNGPLLWIIKLSIFSLIYYAFLPLAYIRRLVCAVALVTGSYSIGMGITNSIICSPQNGQDRAAYMAGMNKHKCSDVESVNQILGVALASTNLVTDIFLLVLPLPAVYGLNLPRARKIGVMAIFMTGSVGCIMSAIALYYRTRFYDGGRASQSGSDYTYANMPIMTVTIIESAVGIMVPCMASCAQAFKFHSSSLRSFLPLRLAGFRRTPSHDDTLKISQELQRLPRASDQPHLDTIDRMLMQFKDDSNSAGSFSHDSRDRDISEASN